MKRERARGVNAFPTPNRSAFPPPLLRRGGLGRGNRKIAATPPYPPLQSRGGEERGAGSCYTGCGFGKRNVAVVPTPASLVSSIGHPNRAESRLTIVSPMP